MNFDKSDSESTFFSLVGQQAIAINETQQQTLSDPWKALELAKQYNVRTVQAVQEVAGVDELTDDMIPERCAIKFANGWSGKGMMLIEREPNNRYFDHHTLRSYGLKQLKQKLHHFYQSNFSDLPQKWRIEDFVDGVLPGSVSPLSYKFYMFNGVLGLISQVDYNYDTPALSLFDGAFKPLALERDYQTNSRDFAVGHPVLPQHAGQYIKAAQQLALASKSPFVAVQLFATEDGPVFAGFDFAPRLIHKRVVKLSTDVIEDLDSKLQGARKRIESASSDYVFGQPVDEAVRLSVMLASVDAAALTALEDLPLWKYKRLANVAAHGQAKGAWRLSDKYKQLHEKAPNKLAALLAERWQASWDAIKQHNTAEL